MVNKEVIEIGINFLKEKGIPFLKENSEYIKEIFEKGIDKKKLKIIAKKLKKNHKREYDRSILIDLFIDCWDEISLSHKTQFATLLHLMNKKDAGVYSLALLTIFIHCRIKCREFDKRIKKRFKDG